MVGHSRVDAEASVRGLVSGYSLRNVEYSHQWRDSDGAYQVCNLNDSIPATWAVSPGGFVYEGLMVYSGTDVPEGSGYSFFNDVLDMGFVQSSNRARTYGSRLTYSGLDMTAVDYSQDYPDTQGTAVHGGQVGRIAVVGVRRSSDAKWDVTVRTFVRTTGYAAAGASTWQAVLTTATLDAAYVSCSKSAGVVFNVSLDNEPLYDGSNTYLQMAGGSVVSTAAAVSAASALSSLSTATALLACEAPSFIDTDSALPSLDPSETGLASLASLSFPSALGAIADRMKGYADGLAGLFFFLEAR